MTSRGVFRNLLIIFTISIVLNIDVTNAWLPSMFKVLNTASKVCHNVEALPGQVCNNTIGFVGTKAKGLCNSGTEDLCQKIPSQIKLLIPDGTCEKMVNKYVCDSIDTAVEMVAKECTGGLERYTIIGQGYDADGNKVSICNGPPTSAESACSMLVGAMCRQLPPPLNSFNRQCQMTFAKLVCRNVMNVLKPAVTTDLDD